MYYNAEPYNKKEGITHGTCMDLCEDCVKEGKKIKRGDLEYQEVFRVTKHGIPVCYCMDHFKKKLGKYILIDSTTLEEDNEEENTNSLTNCETNCDTIKEESEEPIVEDEQPKTEAKKTTRKSSK